MTSNCMHVAHEESTNIDMSFLNLGLPDVVVVA